MLANQSSIQILIKYLGAVLANKSSIQMEIKYLGTI